MEKVTFLYRDGRTKQMAPRYADILQKLKRGTYETRDMRAAVAVPSKEIKADEPKKAGRNKSRKADD